MTFDVSQLPYGSGRGEPVLEIWNGLVFRRAAVIEVWYMGYAYITTMPAAPLLASFRPVRKQLADFRLHQKFP
jgi:hypothetical protein